MNIYFAEQGYQKILEILDRKKYSKLFVLTDSNTNEFCAPTFLAELATEIPIELIEIEAGESQKNIQTCVEIWQILNDLGADRKSVLIGLGGGVITDITGFVASVYKRGIDFINVPTSLLGMVDAAIGGKNGVDLGHLKNQIGTITDAKLVLVDFRFIDSLPVEQIKSGYAEMLKHGLIADLKYFRKLSDLQSIDLGELDELIIRSIAIKTEITERDKTEEGDRKALNFGHTLGHAIESYCMHHNQISPLLHGEAVAIGMVLESYLSYEKGLLNWEEYLEVKNVLMNIYQKINFTDNDMQEIIKLLAFDKKNEYGEILFVLLDRLGNFKINQTIENDLIVKAFQNYSN